MKQKKIAFMFASTIALGACSSGDEGAAQVLADYIYNSGLGSVEDQEALSMIEIRLDTPLKEVVRECVDTALQPYDSAARNKIAEFIQLVESGDDEKGKKWEDENKGFLLTPLMVNHEANNCTLSKMQAVLGVWGQL